MIARMFNQKYNAFVLGALLLSGALVYSGTFYSSFHFDDVASIIENPAIRNILDLRAIWNFCPARFITYLSIALNYRFNHLHVFGYHLLNLAIHLGSAVLTWRLMLLTLSTPAMRGRKIAAHARLIAFFAGLVFVTHPLQTQAVTYIIQRAASLATLFYLASLNFYVASRLLRQQGQNPAASRLFYSGSLIAAVIAMFTKETAATIPFAVLLYEACFLKTKERLDWKHLAPFFAALSIIPLTMLITGSVDVMGIRLVQRSAPTSISPWQYLCTQFQVMATYLRLLLIPIRQNLDYDYRVAKGLLELPVLSSLVLLAALLAAAIRMRSKYRLLSFGIFWFFLTLSVESSIIPIRDIIFEHRLYLPMVGFSFFAVGGIYYLFENRALKPAVIALFIITSCYGVLSYRRNMVWRNDFTLWNDTVQKSPGKARPYNNRGVAYGDQGNFAQAISDYTRAIAISPDYAEAYYNRANAYDKQGNLSQAIADYTRAIAISPAYAAAYNNRANVYNKQGNFAQAIADCIRAIEINPDYAEAYYNRGLAYDKQGDLPQAVADYAKAISLNPNLEKAHNNRGVIYGKQANLAQAIADYSKAIEINPDYAEAYYNRANAYDKQGNFTQAIADYTKAVALNPNYAAAYNNRGVAYGARGKFAQAIADCTRAIEINPNLEQAYNNRGLAYDKQGDLPQAVADYTKAIAVNPVYTEAYYNRGLAYHKQGNFTQAVADYTKVIEMAPRFAPAYNNRGAAYYRTAEYGKAWADVHQAEALGAVVDPRFLESLKKASGTDK
ncbi:MAG TPA: tetratricopeptide repeat protein [Patescibacteria group bacterium]|nr:tetratricopeptide repeat protein [Patescibacteria group bacterium]